MNHNKTTKESEKEPIRLESKTPITDMMRRMGSNRGFTPLPPDQHEWQKTHDDPVLRLWSWMVSHSVGHPVIEFRREWAVDEFGHDVDIARAEKDIGGEPANIRRAWRKGEKLRFWRKGTKEEGGKRLYFSGKVCLNVPYSEVSESGPEGEEKATEVCADLLPSSIFKKTKGWPPERVAELGRKWEELEELDREVNSALMAARRCIFEREQNNLLARFGVKHESQKHRKQGESEEEAKVRYSRFEPVLSGLENLVQSFREKLCTESEKTLHTPQNGSVQTSLYKELEKEREKTIRAGGTETVVTEAPARPNGVPKSPPEKTKNGNSIGHHSDEWRAGLRDWLEANCPISTACDVPMFERIAFYLSTETLEAFKAAALAVKNPRKWAVYESVAKQVAARGEVPAVNRKTERSEEWEAEMYRKYGKKEA